MEENEIKNKLANCPEKTPSDFELYKILINARQFHYENFNKWMTYFYVAIGALFIGYTTIIGKDKTHLEYSIIILGYITSLFWHWSSKGYYYWNINFINLVNHYEKRILEIPIEKRVYFVFANKKTQNSYLNPASGANISTSKVAILFAFTVTIVWGTLLFYILLKDQCDILWFTLLNSIVYSIIITLLLSFMIPKFFLFSKHNHFPDLKIDLEELSDKENS